VAGPALALTVSEKVGPLIKEAQTLAQAKNYKAARAKLDEAEAVKVYADDETVINQLRHYIAVASDPTHPYCTGAGIGITRCDGRRATGGTTITVPVPSQASKRPGGMQAGQ
jgi:hypothetical protein